MMIHILISTHATFRVRLLTAELHHHYIIPLPPDFQTNFFQFSSCASFFRISAGLSQYYRHGRRNVRLRDTDKESENGH